MSFRFSSILMSDKSGSNRSSGVLACSTFFAYFFITFCVLSSYVGGVCWDCILLDEGSMVLSLSDFADLDSFILGLLLLLPIVAN